MKNKKKEIIIMAIIIIILLLMIVLIFIFEHKKEVDVTNAIHGIIVENDAQLIYKKNRKMQLAKGERVFILEEDMVNHQYKVKYGGVVGTVNKDVVSYYSWNQDEKYSLMCDVSQFNKETNFKTEEEFEVFLLSHPINYVYIRLGGRGWGQKGNMYYDKESSMYIDACEYLEIPYGFYYLDEALNEEEIQEEVSFVKKFLEENRTSKNVLPLVIDLEYQEGQGRADNIWNERVPILTELISSFNENNISCMVYANGLRANKYLADLETAFWVAMYPEEGIIPEASYPSTMKYRQMQKIMNQLLDEDGKIKKNLDSSREYKITYSDDFLNKVIGWQFTENGAKEDGIEEELDLSLVRNDFFIPYVTAK